MKKKTFLDPRPEAFIAKAKNRMKHKKLECAKTYFMQEGEFQIELVNPYDKRIAFSLSVGDFNEPSEPTHILEPGQTLFLEKLPSTDNKLYFKIYESKASNFGIGSVDSPTIKTGLINIHFYDINQEIQKSKPEPTVTKETIIEKHIYVYPPARINKSWPWWQINMPSSPNWYNHTNISDNFQQVNYVNNDKINTLSFEVNSSYSAEEFETNQEELLKAGIIIDGEQSIQQLEPIVTKPRYTLIAFESIRLRPLDMMDYYITARSTAIKLYCNDCGKKHKKEANFCSKCGSKLK